MVKKVLIFGASRGLGRAVALYSPVHFDRLTEIHLVSRKIQNLQGVANEIKIQGFRGEIVLTPLDLTLDNAQIQACGLFKGCSYDLVIYCAGGGPHGEFGKKEWKDHKWAMELNLLAPARLLHSWIHKMSVTNKASKFIAVGSRVAENSPDPLAASYSSGKSGLHGLLNSLQAELENKPYKAWLFSPGYMDTEMLPSTAKVRHDGSKLMSSDAAAQALLRWSKKDEPWHRVLN
jgi:short-subunit dehydrogenase